MWISRWGVAFTGSRVTPFVEEPLSETRVPDIPTACTPPCGSTPAFRGWRGQGLTTPAEWNVVQEEGQASLLSPSPPLLPELH